MRRFTHKSHVTRARGGRSWWLRPCWSPTMPAARTAHRQHFQTSTAASLPQRDDHILGEGHLDRLDWRASLMANSARDPYWRRACGARSSTTFDSPIEDAGADCHMPMARTEANLVATRAVFAHLRSIRRSEDAEPATACPARCATNQGGEILGTPQSFSGGFVIGQPTRRASIRSSGRLTSTTGAQRIMQSSTGGFRRRRRTHPQVELCASCHTLITTGLRGRRASQSHIPRAGALPGVAPQRVSRQQSVSPATCRQVQEDAPIVRVLAESAGSRGTIRGCEFLHAAGSRSLSTTSSTSAPRLAS